MWLKTIMLFIITENINKLFQNIAETQTSVRWSSTMRPDRTGFDKKCLLSGFHFLVNNISLEG